MVADRTVTGMPNIIKPWAQLICYTFFSVIFIRINEQ
jgi:hypothetical protein